MRHDASRALDVHADVLFLERAVATGLGQNGYDALARCRIVERAGEGWNVAASGRDRNHERCEGAGDALTLRVQLSIAGERISGEGKQLLTEVAGVKVDVILRGSDH